MTEDRFHNDDSSWKVFDNIEGKIGNRWWLWVRRSVLVVYFQITPGRGADMPVEYFENIKKEKVIVICDRYSVYKTLARQHYMLCEPFTTITCQRWLPGTPQLYGMNILRGIIILVIVSCLVHNFVILLQTANKL